MPVTAKDLIGTRAILSPLIRCQRGCADQRVHSTAGQTLQLPQKLAAIGIFTAPDFSNGQFELFLFGFTQAEVGRLRYQNRNRRSFFELSVTNVDLAVDTRAVRNFMADILSRW